MNQIIFLCLFLPIIGGCNSLFYFPDAVQRLTPQKFDLQYEPITLKTADGEALAAWHIHAVKPKVGSVLQFHGNAENMTGHFLFVVWMAQAGFDIYTFDYRGYGASTGSPSRRGIFHDGLLALKTFGSKDQNFYVVAQSLGGAIAVPAVAESTVPNLKALVLESTFESYRNLAQDKLSQFFLTWPLQWPLSFLVSDDLSPINYAAMLRVPTLVIHGDMDRVVPLERGEALFDSIKSGEKNIRIVEGGFHTPAFINPQSDLPMDVLKFFCTHHSTPDTCSKRILKWQKEFQTYHQSTERPY